MFYFSLLLLKTQQNTIKHIRNTNSSLFKHRGSLFFRNAIRFLGKGKVIIYITVASSEAVLAYAILQFCINVYNVYSNIPVSKAISQNRIKVKQRHRCRSTSENLIKFMVSDFFVYVFLSKAWMGMMNCHQVHFHTTAQ